MATRRKAKKTEAPAEVKPEEVQAEEVKTAEETSFVPQYDVTSTERYVDSTSQKTEFEKVIAELARISLDTLSWDILKMTRKHFGETEEGNALKLEAYLGGFIVNAASTLFDKGLEEVAYRKLDEAKKVLETKKKLAQEVEAIRLKTQEDSIDVADMLGFMPDEPES